LVCISWNCTTLLAEAVVPDFASLIAMIMTPAMATQQRHPTRGTQHRHTTRIAITAELAPVLDWLVWAAWSGSFVGKSVITVDVVGRRVGVRVVGNRVGDHDVGTCVVCAVDGPDVGVYVSPSRVGARVTGALVKGAELGLAEGEELGDADGDVLGLAEGEALGATEGTVEGTAVGN